MMPSLDQTKPDPSACEVYVRSPPNTPNGSKNGSTARRRMVDSVWMFTTAGRTLCATTTIGVRRAALTLDGIGAISCRGWPGLVVCDSAIGLQATEMAKRTTRMRTCFMADRILKSWGLGSDSWAGGGASGLRHQDS